MCSLVRDNNLCGFKEINLGFSMRKSIGRIFYFGSKRKVTFLGSWHSIFLILNKAIPQGPQQVFKVGYSLASINL